jgi:holliday junction DNA helicase RuvA
MIGSISGKVQAHLGGKIIVKTSSGIGYVVNVSSNLDYMVSDNVELYILHVQREDAVELHGFKELEDRMWVDKLLKVNGVGPKAASNIIYTLGWQKLAASIRGADAKTIQAVKGLGLKTVKKILLELKGADVDLDEIDVRTLKGQTVTDFTDTLSNLGYKRGQIVAVITQLKKDGHWEEDNLMGMVKLGLKYLGK